jgi:hypothetical protein
MASQERLKRELLAFVKELTHRQPVVLFLDDLHWADASTIDVLSYVASRCGSERILIVGTYRPSELLETKPALLRAKLELQAHGLCHESLMQFLRLRVECYLAAVPKASLSPELAVESMKEQKGIRCSWRIWCVSSEIIGLFTHRDGYWGSLEQLPALGHELPVGSGSDPREIGSSVMATVGWRRRRLYKARNSIRWLLPGRCKWTLPKWRAARNARSNARFRAANRRS